MDRRRPRARARPAAEPDWATANAEHEWRTRRARQLAGIVLALVLLAVAIHERMTFGP